MIPKSVPRFSEKIMLKQDGLITRDTAVAPDDDKFRELEEVRRLRIPSLPTYEGKSPVSEVRRPFSLGGCAGVAREARGYWASYALGSRRRMNA